MLKIGVVGAGHLGKIHLKLIRQISEYQLVGFYDIDAQVRAEVSKQFNCKAYESVQDLIRDSDVVDIVTPTLSHFEIAELALKNFKHVFIEKPVANTVEEAKRLLNLSEEAQVMIQVGHIERFNPAFQAVEANIDSPMFIEVHRLSQFNPRGTDVSVILDLMIHDIDIVLSQVPANIKKIHASGVNVVSDTPDIANVRLEFDNGCVANLTASRVSMKTMRKARFFQRNKYISVDFMNKKAEVVTIEPVGDDYDPFDFVIDPGEGKEKKKISFEKPDIEESNALLNELQTFANAINTNTQPIVSIHDGTKALEVAHQILNRLNLTSEIF